MNNVGVMITLTARISSLVWLRKKGFWRERSPSLFDSITPVFSMTYMSSGGHPEVIYETTTCCSRRQLRVKPMKRGVLSGTCFEGGKFHFGTGGKSAGDRAEAAKGKLSMMGRDFGGDCGLYFG